MAGYRREAPGRSLRAFFSFEAKEELDALEGGATDWLGFFTEGIAAEAAEVGDEGSEGGEGSWETESAREGAREPSWEVCSR